MSITINHQTNEISATSGSISIDGTSPSATQDQATWEAGTSTTETIVSPAKVKPAIDALAGFSFLSSTAVSGASTGLTFTSGYDVFLIVYEGVICSTVANPLYMRLSSDGGSTLLSSGYASASNWGSTGTGTATAQFYLANDTNDNSGFLLVTRPRSSTTKTSVQGLHSYKTAVHSQAGIYDSATAHDFFALLPSAGTLTAGNIYLYGMK